MRRDRPESGWRKLFSPVARNWRASTRWCIRRWCAARGNAAEFARRKPDGIFVVEAAILIRNRQLPAVDRLILVICTEEQQVERAMRREGAVEAVVRARLSRQMPVDDKRKFAHFVIDTSGTKENTLRQTEPSTRRYGELNHETDATISMGRRAGGRLPGNHFRRPLEARPDPAKLSSGGRLWEAPVSAASEYSSTSKTT